MKLQTLLSPFARATSYVGVKANKYGSELALGFAISTFFGTVIAATAATFQADGILEQHNARLRDFQQARDLAIAEPDKYDYPAEVHARDKKLLTIQTGVQMLRLYAPAVALAGLSVTSMLVSRNILQRRYLGALCAYNSVSEAFEAYRKRVREEEGVLMDRHYRYGTELEEITVEEVDENGKKKKKKELVEVPGTGDIELSDTSRWWDESRANHGWDPNPNFSKMFLRGKLTYLNELLHDRGHLFLNEVYEELGYDHTSVGAMVGWIDTPERDKQIDFGIYADTEDARAFVNGKTNRILLEFNVDGIIWDKI